MLGRINWLARFAGYAWIGVVAFVLVPPHGTYAVSARAAGYALLGLALVAGVLLDNLPRPVPDRARLLAVVYGAMAVGSGFGSAVGTGGLVLITFAFVAALLAGGDLDLGAALGVGAAGVLAIEISGLLSGGGYLTFLALPVFVPAGLVIGRNRGAYRVQAEQAEALLAQREALDAQQRQMDLLGERARIAREIHDVLAHSLGALGIQIQAARAVLTDSGDVAKATELLGTAQQLASDGLVETRRAVHALRADARPLAEELADVSDTYARRYQVPVEFGTDGAPEQLPPDVSLALLRVTQEALVNAVKHAGGRQVRVRLDWAEHCVRLTVRNLLPEDPAAAPVHTADTGYGLTGMRERLHLLGGTVDAGRRGREWIVTAELPRPGTMAR